MGTFSFQLVSPEKEYFSGSTEMVVLPGEEGDFSVLPDHAPIITYLRPGRMTIKSEKGDELIYFVASGFVKINENYCQVLVDYIKKKSDLNLEEIKRELTYYLAKFESEKDQLVIETLKEKITILKEEINFLEYKY